MNHLATLRELDSADEDKQLVSRDKINEWISRTLHDDQTLACDDSTPLEHIHV